MLKSTDQPEDEKCLVCSNRELIAWMNTNNGQAFIARQKHMLDEQLRAFHGYELLELTAFPSSNFCQASPIKHHMTLSPTLRGAESALADFEALPLPDECVDVIVLHHILDFARHPHQVLREANRVLKPNGHLLLMGFNPCSWLGLYRAMFRCVAKSASMKAREVSLFRIKDWVRLLDLQSVKEKHGYFVPKLHWPLCNRLERWLSVINLPVGGFYFMVVRKDRVQVIPSRHLWNLVNPLSGSARPMAVANCNTPQKNLSKIDTDL